MQAITGRNRIKNGKGMAYWIRIVAFDSIDYMNERYSVVMERIFISAQSL